MYDIYHSDRDDHWRFSLGRSGRRPLIIIGLNPSTATKEHSDPTVARVQKVAERNGFDGFIMLNLYPVRATDWNELPQLADPEAFKRNQDEIERLVSQYERPTLWAAWGQTVTQRSFFMESRDALYENLSKHQPQWHRFGTLTKGGHPRHPVYLSYEWKLEPFELK